MAEELREVYIDQLGSVHGRIPGNGNAAPLVVTAHTDTVFPDGTDLTIQRTTEQIIGPGIGDNALGVAGLFGLIWQFQTQKYALPGDIILIANAMEEGLGNSQGMRAVVEKFRDRALAYVVLEGMNFGHIFHRGTSVERYSIKVQTPGGHSWVDFGRPSAVHELARIVDQITKLSTPENPRTTVNIGKISGGTTVNSIAAHAELELDLRSEQPEVVQGLVGQIENILERKRAADVRVEMELIGQRPPGEIPANHPLVQLAANSLRALNVDPQLSVGSTDANQPLSRGLPAICIGLTTGGDAHTSFEYIDLEPIARGFQQLLAVVTGAYERLI